MLLRVHRRWRTRCLIGTLRETHGQSLIELAVMLPLLFALTAYAVDFGYFFVAAASVTSAARQATQYSIMGYVGPAQTNLPPAGPMTTINSVSAAALAELASLISSSTTTTVEVCSKQEGMSGSLAKCSSYGPSGTVYTPAADPEAPTFVLQRVDVTYVVQPPIPLAFFNVSLLPTMAFHRQVSMRAMD